MLHVSLSSLVVYGGEGVLTFCPFSADVAAATATSSGASSGAPGALAEEMKVGEF
jgi:hypothetical protein